MRHLGTRQKTDADVGEDKAGEAAVQVVNQYQPARSAGHATQQLNGLWFWKVMEKQRTGDEVVPARQTVAEGVATKEADRCARLFSVLTSMFDGSLANIAPVNFQTNARTTSFVPQRDRHIAGARGDIEQAPTTLRLLSCNFQDRRPEYAGTAAEEIHSRQARECSVMSLRIEFGLIHELGLQASLSQVWRQYHAVSQFLPRCGPARQHKNRFATNRPTSPELPNLT